MLASNEIGCECNAIILLQMRYTDTLFTEQEVSVPSECNSVGSKSQMIMSITISVLVKKLVAHLITNTIIIDPIHGH